MSADGASVYFQGTQYDKNPQQVGPKSFIDQVNIKTGEKKRIYESDNSNVFERVSNVIDINSGKYIVLREGPKTVPQGILVDGANRKQLTNNEDLAPDLTNMQIERFTVERPDGFKFRVTVNLPANYVKGTKLPALFWFYPSEFTTQEAYDQPDRSFNKNAFATFNMRSMEYFTRLGYAVVENDAPIVGPAGQMNNNYVNDLRNDLSATIDELDRRMLVDRTRLAIISALAAHSPLTFTELKQLLDLSDGNLSVHARKLEDAGYVTCTKGFEGRLPKTQFSLNEAGHRALRQYLDHMEAIIKHARTKR